MSQPTGEQATVDLFKYYSNIRFLMLPLFFTAMGAVTLAYWTIHTSTPADSEFIRLTALAGVMVSLFFSLYEWKLSSTLFKVSGLLPKSMNSLKHNRIFGLVTISTLLFYLLPGLFWAFRAFLGS